MHYTPHSELIDRIARLQRLLAANDLDCVLIRHNPDLFYFAGTIQNAHLFIPGSGRPLLLVRRDHLRARLESQLDDVLPLPSLRDLPRILSHHRLRFASLGLELDVLPASQYLSYERMFGGVRLTDASALIREIRGLKSAWEVARIEEAADQADLMFRTARDTLREGISEIELAAEVEKAGRVNGHQGLIRMRSWNSEIVFGYLISGLAGGIPSHVDAAAGGVGLSPALGQGAGFRRIRRGEPVLVDVTGCVDGYCADQTRVIVLGPVPGAVRDAYDAMRTVYTQLRDSLRPGVACASLYDRAVALAGEAGYGDYFMGPKHSRLAFVGHGLGLELDEPPPLATGITATLAEGMVIALEPKAIIPGLGAIGLENSHLITKDGCRTLTSSEEVLTVV